MAKRLVSTDIWEQVWFQDATPKHRMFYQWLYAACNVAGVWIVNYKKASFVIGETITKEDLEALPEEEFQFFGGGKYLLLTKFISEQYGELKDSRTIFKTVLQYLKDAGLTFDVESQKVVELYTVPGTVTGTQPIPEKKQKKKQEKEKESGTEKPKSDFTICVDLYNKFIKTQAGAPAKFDGAEGKAMKTIIEYLSKTEKVLANEVKVPEVWGFILDHYQAWDSFRRGQLKLVQINSNLINILNDIKNGAANKNRGNRSGESAKISSIANAVRAGVQVDFSVFDTKASD